jgi:hypothetical protein
MPPEPEMPQMPMQPPMQAPMPMGGPAQQAAAGPAQGDVLRQAVNLAASELGPQAPQEAIMQLAAQILQQAGIAPPQQPVPPQMGMQQPRQMGPQGGMPQGMPPQGMPPRGM